VVRAARGLAGRAAGRDPAAAYLTARGRFVYDDGTLYALKELSERLARREYRLLRVLADLNIPAVEAIGIAVDLDEAHPRQPDADAILVTRFLTYAAPTSSRRMGIRSPRS
jgi:hypothetical protein